MNAAAPSAAATEKLAVLGLGTMGCGIAEVGLGAGLEVLAFDPVEGAIERARERIARHLDESAAERLQQAGSIAEVASATFVIEAVPERLELKREILREAEAATEKEAVLASNTSSLLVSEIATALEHPQRLVGMHFFNPVPKMRLVEVVAGHESWDHFLARAGALARTIGKTPIDATDCIGFLVNRCARPFSSEALQLLAEGVADVETIDRSLRLGAGFRLGPFELMDLIGLDVSLDVQRSFYSQSFNEPRWRPSEIQANLVAAGRLGRKSGAGWYSYPRSEQRDTVPPRNAGVEGPCHIAGRGAIASGLRALALEHGIALTDEPREAWLHIDASPEPTGGEVAADVVCCLSDALGRRADHGSIGFLAIPPLSSCSHVELTRGAGSETSIGERMEAFCSTIDLRSSWVEDAPGLVAGRVVAQLSNEAHFTLQRRLGSEADIDLGTTVGLNWPRGPFAWTRELGAKTILRTLENLQRATGEDRYRAARLLRSRAALEQPTSS